MTLTKRELLAVKIGVIGCEEDATHDMKTALTLKYGKEMGMSKDECEELMIDVAQALHEENVKKMGLKEKMNPKRWF